jgi:chromosome partitioning protein
MAPLLERKSKPIKFGEGALRFVRQDNAFDGVQLRRRRPSKGQAPGRSFPGFLGVCLHSRMIPQNGFGLKRLIRPAKQLGDGWILQSNRKHAAVDVIAACFQQDFIVQSYVCSAFSSSLVFSLIVIMMIFARFSSPESPKDFDLGSAARKHAAYCKFAVGLQIGGAMAMIIGLGSHKGGVGKTTFSRAIALVAAAQRLAVHIADLDQEQQSAFEWAQRREASGRGPKIPVDVYGAVGQALAGAEAYDLVVLDGPARAKAMALDIARASDLFIQPTKGVIDDMAPAVRMFHELVKHGVPKEKLVFVLHGVLAEKEIEDGTEYLSSAGYEVLKGAMFMQRAYGDAQNFGLTALETKWESLNTDAARVVASVIRKVRAIVEAESSANGSSVAAA